MLSRIAAVKAPRTHNRRRVTGSSGRRREGRESEQQRPNMSRRVFTSAVLLFLVAMGMCCGIGAAAAVESNGAAQASASQQKTYFDWRDVNDDNETVSSLRVPSLIEMNGNVFAVAEAGCTKKDDKSGFNGIASELLRLNNGQPKEKLDKTKLNVQVLDKCPFEGGNCPSQDAAQAGSQDETKVHVSRPTTVVRGSGIYMLAGNYSGKSAAVAGKTEKDNWGLLLVKGNVSDGDSGSRIHWKDTYGLPWTLFKKQHGSLTRLIGSGGSGVKATDGTIVFPVEATMNNDAENDGKQKTVSLFIYSRDIASWTLSKGMSDDGCSGPSVVEWKEKKLIMMTVCDDGRRRVYEIGDKGKSWTEARGTLSRVWGNKKGGSGVGGGFITANIEERKVMLVTVPVYAKKADKKENQKGELHLWLTDNTHIVDIGPVSGGDADDVAARPLLYKSGGIGSNKEELIALYEKKKKGDGEASPGMVSVLLTAELQRVKEVLATWKEVDDIVSKLCSSSTEKHVSTGTNCSAVKITDGLVGFLSGNFSGNTWRDEYLGVNATVNNKDGAEKTDHGVKFKGLGAGAEWPVGMQGENQLYHFANYNFTLVATVSIHKVPTKEVNIPLLGVRVGNKEENKFLELSYDSGKKWRVLCTNEPTKEHNNNWETGKTYQVALMLENGTQGSVYVDGERVGGDRACELKNTDSKKAISHFYIGGDGGSAGNPRRQEDVSVTVTNVLLYNRLLSSEEIGFLNANKISIPKTVDEGNSSSVVPRPKRSAEPLAEGATRGVTTRHVGAHVDSSTVHGSELLPLLLLLGLWGFAAL
ncbi:trans-sialidase, putative [Trypanosoma cruzi marinkellei]|uniref:Trans-sialidase, putative n=1 Tax=Trypanosoma cruzi marinkellei TaxID=85056 RepID=K2MHH2_TRYCR|nr:trans-sialidase, putative [Trypanosoma cruzi marinkellei]